MLSFAQIANGHAPCLILDAASALIQVGLVSGQGEVRWSRSASEAGVGLFRAVEELGVDLPKLRAFAYCEGPGSMLGTRTAAMAIRVWCGIEPRPVFGYFSLALVAEACAKPGDIVIADARREHWHCQARGEPLRRVPAGLLAGQADSSSRPSGRILTPSGFRHWTPLPPGVQTVPYALDELFARAGDADLFRPVEAPDAFRHEEPQYAAWTPRPHLAK
jgi:tRNA threonylcarbamoyladenosine biosynthesis protein TsaB